MSIKHEWTVAIFPVATRQGRVRNPLSKRQRQFHKEKHLPLKRCERGPDRSMTAGQLHDFVQLPGIEFGIY